MEFQIFVDGLELFPNTGTQSFGLGSTPADMQLFSSSFFSGGSRTSIGSGTSRDGLSFDDFFENAVPEPGTVMLIAMGLAAFFVGALI